MLFRDPQQVGGERDEDLRKKIGHHQVIGAANALNGSGVEVHFKAVEFGIFLGGDNRRGVDVDPGGGDAFQQCSRCQAFGGASPKPEETGRTGSFRRMALTRAVVYATSASLSKQRCVPDCGVGPHQGGGRLGLRLSSFPSSLQYGA